MRVPVAPGASLAAVPDPFADHPEPELVDVRDEAVSRPALERFGRALWDEALRYLYEDAMQRPLRSLPYPEMRRTFFGPSGEPSAAPEKAANAADVLGEFRERVAPYVFNTQHPGSYSYFTPPPLAMSIAGELLAQWVNQGVDVWVAGPVGALVEEEVTAWLRALIGFGGNNAGVVAAVLVYRFLTMIPTLLVGLVSAATWRRQTGAVVEAVPADDGLPPITPSG